MIDIIIPMAGLGTRFIGTLDSAPKPLIEVMPRQLMIEFVIDYLTLTEPHRFIFICLERHAGAFDFATFFRARTASFELVLAATPTRGPAASALLAAPLLDGRAELIIAYCDSFLTANMALILNHHRMKGADGGVITYPSENRFDSYAEVDAAGRVLRTAEKQLISKIATTGNYYFRRADDFIEGARLMIEHTPNREAEHFVNPVFNELIRAGKKVLAYPIRRDEKIEMGTPADLADARRTLAQTNWGAGPVTLWQ